MSTHPPVASFMGIPSELRIAIFEYLLPLQDLKYNCLIRASYAGFPESCRPIRPEFLREGEHTWDLACSSTLRAWRPTYVAILRINPQCKLEATSILRQRTLSIGTISDTDDSFDWLSTHGNLCIDRISRQKQQCQCKPYILFWNQLWVPQTSILRTLELIISPLNEPGYWSALQWSMTMFVHHHLDKPPKNLIVKLFDMARADLDPLTQGPPDRLRRRGSSTISATIEDYMETLQIFQHVAPKAENCQICLPYWMERKFQTTALKKEWDVSPGVKVHFMPLGAWPNPTEYLPTLDLKIRLPKSAYQTPVSGVPQNKLSWAAQAWSPNKEAPEEVFDESRVREGYVFLADLAEGAQ